MISGRHRRVPNARATVVFIHHFGGNRKSSARHQKLMQALGFDTFAFDLSHNQIPSWQGLKPKGLDFGGLSPTRIWVRELRVALDQIDGPKILFSFSFPSVGVAFLLAEQARPDILAWIRDGGPFLDMLSCQFRLFTFAQPTRGLRKYVLTLAAWAVMGGPFYARAVKRAMPKISTGLPILSIRAGLDELVPPAAIAEFSGANPRLSPEVFDLPEARHLEGLKNFAPAYTARVASFCAKVTGDGKN